MAGETNGGLTTGQRLERIENAITILQSEVRSNAAVLNDRVSRHKDANREQVRKMAQTIVDSFDSRIKMLENHDVAEDAVKSYKRWAIGTALAFLAFIIGNTIALVNVLGKV